MVAAANEKMLVDVLVIAVGETLKMEAVAMHMAVPFWYTGTHKMP